MLTIDGSLQDLLLVGDGEPMLRLEKRLHCAAAGLGLPLKFAVRRDYDSFGLAQSDTPAVLLGGKVVFAGLPCTEALEEWLRTLFVTGAVVANSNLMT